MHEQAIKTSLERSTRQLVFALLDFLVALKESPVASGGAHPEPMQCGEPGSVVSPGVAGRMLPPSPEHEPIQRRHLPVRCSSGMEGPGL